MEIDIQSLTFVGLAVLGAVNVITLFFPTLESKYKWMISVAVAFAVGFVPAELGNEIATRIKDAVIVATQVSGGYKIFQLIGSKRS